MSKQIEPGSWPFRLTDQEEVRAIRLHRDSVIVDMLNQHPGGSNIFDCYDPILIQRKINNLESGIRGMAQAIQLPYELAVDGISDLIRDWWDISGITVGTLHIPMGSKQHMEGPLKGYFDLVVFLKQIPWLRLVTTVDDIRDAKRENIHALYGYWQPVYGLANNLEDVDSAYEQGLRMLMLTYNRMDYVGSGCTERVDAGLSSFGIDLVRHCNELGIIVDTSHCGARTTLDACRYSKAPVFANHTVAKGVYEHARGKSDEELKAIAASGGVIGVVTVPAFLGLDPSIETVLDHIDYIIKTVGWQHVGIGTDSPMQSPKSVIEETLGAIKYEIGFRPEDNIKPSLSLPGFDDCRDMPNITRGLVSRGYSDEQIKGILGENFLRVFGEVCG